MTVAIHQTNIAGAVPTLSHYLFVLRRRNRLRAVRVV